MIKQFTLTMAMFILILTSTDIIAAEKYFDIETGVVFSGYNDVRIPGDSGTKFSFTDDLNTNPENFYRLRFGMIFNSTHEVSILYAPLRLNASGSINRDVYFDGGYYPAETPLQAKYRFDSYRLTYRYNFYKTEAITFGAGLTAKVRDASISLDGEQYKEKNNTGLVGLINFKLGASLSDSWAFVFEGDALAAPQGRAEDVALTFNYSFNDYIEGRFGYRMLEGGADNDEVYTFSLFHYALLGMTAFF